ncbi:TetR/AcrR family transcriptional regulator [Streptomyces sp. WMMC897]|nr:MULTISPECIES: TetR/AcrR family transcriptional regulator [unclassified Streptomyces]MCZ7415997.1 TetR/AcrR family transcriptional regulator [Streptomyces sp. WMMC897]MCZ7434196.1 TetR/AcrR family transcriptional regulator [Streptomyces sp. WMMC1477]
MHEGSDWHDRPVEDLTSRARIRDAALAQFAEHGSKGATIKSIAAAAGVSPGLLQHHFGSKKALQEACDAYVMAAFDGLDRFGLNGGEITKPDFVEELLAKSSLVIRYIARAMVEGSPLAAALFDNGAAVAEEFLVGIAPDRFPAGSAEAGDAGAVMAAMHFATIVLHDHLGRRMGDDVLAPQHSHRIGVAMLDIYAAMAEFAASSAGDGIRSAVDSHERRTNQSYPPTTDGRDDE